MDPQANPFAVLSLIVAPAIAVQVIHERAESVRGRLTRRARALH
jgi:hypothetical protein